MSHELKEGVELESVIGPQALDGSVFIAKLGSEPHRCKRIVVSEQPGQMSMVPWARCEFNNGDVVMANLALMESVTIKETRHD